MPANNSGQSILAIRYANALIECAVETKALDKIEADVKDLSASLAGSQELQAMIRHPLLSRKNQESAMAAIATKGKFHKLTKQFLAVLSQNRRLAALPEILDALQVQMSERKGEMTAHVTTATVLTDKQSKALVTTLKKQLGNDVTLDVKVDEDILGGMIVRVGSTMVDDSVKTKLERMTRFMKGQSKEQQTA